MGETDSYSLLIEKVNLFIRRYYLNNLLRGLIFLAAGLLSAYIIITVLEYFVNFDTVLRSVLFYGFIIINLILLFWLIIPSLLAYFRLGKTLTHHEAAEIIGQHFGDIKDKLLNTLQLKQLAAQDAQHRELIEASIHQKIATLNPVSFPKAVNLNENRRYIKWVAFPVAAIIVIAFAAPSILTESTKRLIRHDQYFAPVAPFQFIVTNKTLSATQGKDFQLEIRLTGNQLPADVYLETGNNVFKANKESLSHFRYQFSNLQKNTVFRITANGYSSTQYTILVHPRPSLINFDTYLIYPAYLHKAPLRLQNAGDLTVPAGTIIKWDFHTQNADDLLFSLDRDKRLIHSTGKNVFKHSERITKTSVYTVEPLTQNVTSGDVSSYSITAIPDAIPAITVEQKQDSISSKAIYFTGGIRDDHGFSSLTFHYSLSKPGSKNKHEVSAIKADLSGTQAAFFYFWDLKNLKVWPGSTLTYYFEVADNDGLTRPKKVRSAEQTLQMPTENQLNEQLDANAQAIKLKMQSAIKIAAQVEREAQKLNQLLLNKSTLSFDEKKQIEDLLNKKAELNMLLKDIQSENKKDLYNRNENQQQSKELLEKQKQLEDLFNNVLDQKTQELLKKLQDLLNNDQKDGARDELSKMQNDNKSLKKELDRMLELYKQLDFDQKLNQSINLLEKLAEKQQKLAEQTKQGDQDKQDLQREQHQLKNEFDEVKKSLDELEKANEQLERKNNFENPEKEKENIEQQMDKSNDQLQKDDKKNAAQFQNKAAEQMKQMAKKLQQDNQQGEQKEAQIDVKQLRDLLKSLVNSSFEQERIMQSFKNMGPSDPGFVQLSQRQKDIRDNLKTAEDSLYALSRRVPQIQAAVNKEVAGINDNINKSLEYLGDRRIAEANRNQQYAMTSMNNLALMLNEALENMQNAMSNGKSKGGKKQMSMSQLSKMQQQLNQNMQKMREQLQKQGNQGQSKPGQERQGQGISEQMAKMARQQQQIRQQLEELSRQQTKDGKGKSGILDKISKEMEQTENDLVNKKITEESLQRQQQIQSRLLDAEKAEQEREQDKQRQGQAAKDLPPGYIKALQSYQQKKAKQTEQLKTVPPVLNYYYKQKIKRYFDQINAK